jgi:hypothetical protein
MRASWREDDFKALIRLHLLLPVNPKTGAQKCDWCREPRGPPAYRAEMLGKEECTDEVIENQLTFVVGTFPTSEANIASSAVEVKADEGRALFDFR